YLHRDQLADDLTKVRRLLEVFHPNPYFHSDSSVVIQMAKSLVADLPDSISRVEAYRRLNQFVVFYNDGHTRLYASDLFNDYKTTGGLFFPLQLEIVAGQLLLRKVLSPDVEIPINQVVTAINGVPVESILTTLESHASRETQLSDWTLINANFPYFWWLAYGWTGPVEIEVGGSTYNLKGVTWQQVLAANPEQKQNVFQTVDFRMLDDEIAHMRILDFNTWSRKQFRKAYADAFRLFKQQNAKYLILDLRNHDGGDSRYGEDLARYFADEPFRTFGYSEWKVTPEFKKVFKKVYIPWPVRFALPIIKGFNHHTKAIYSTKDHGLARVEFPLVKPKRSEQQFNGQVYLLIDGNTFSAGSSFAAMFKDYKMGTILGQPSGNVVNFYADAMLRSTLDHSQ
ncbi:MAG: S41 family peptidase, partial [Bacteroidota bacterium]